MSYSPSRSTALSRARKGTMRSASDFYRQLEENILPVLLLAAVVVSVVAAWLIGPSYEGVAQHQEWDEVFRCGTLAGVALLAVLGCTAWITAHAFMHSEHTVRLALLAIFVGVAVILTVALYLWFVNRKNDTLAFWLVVLAVVLVLFHTFLCFRALRVMGVVGMIPAILLGAYLLWRFWVWNDVVKTRLPAGKSRRPTPVA